MIVFLFQTGCTDNSSISMTVSGTTQEKNQDIEMDLAQIQAGDYASLLGTWKEVAYADNRFDGTGQQWHTGRWSDTDSPSLSVSTDKISYNESIIIMQGNTLTDGMGDTYPIEFEKHGKDGSSLEAHTDFNAHIYWSIRFYPKGAENHLEPNNGVQIDNTKNLIVVYYSGMRSVTVFAQE